MATKRSKSATKPLSVEEVAAFSPETVIDAQESCVKQDQTWRDAMQTMLDEEFGKDEVTIRRWACSFILALTSSVCIGYAIGKILAITMFGAYMLGLNFFLCVLIYMAGMILAWCTAATAAQYVSQRVLNKTYDRAWDATKIGAAHVSAKVNGWFTKDPVGVYA